METKNKFDKIVCLNYLNNSCKTIVNKIVSLSYIKMFYKRMCILK